MQVCVVEAMKAFYQNTKVKPAKIVYFRDGVGEGMMITVLEQEVKAIKDACKQLQINIPITAIVVTKRHHARFFPDQRDADRSGNAPPGTVVDRGICGTNEFDFYLQSHSGLLGTSRPTKYTVIHDDNRLSADDLQTMCHNLCHVYSRATRSVSVVPPVYYADIVAARARWHFSPDLGDYSDLASTVSGSTNEEAEAAMIKQWVSGYKPVHSALAKAQYFM